jgi:hypothetical protein
MQSQHRSPSGSPSLKAIRSQQLAEKLSLEEETGDTAVDASADGSGTFESERSLRDNEPSTEGNDGPTLAQRLFGSQQQQSQEPDEDSDYLLAMKLQRFYDGQSENQEQALDHENVGSSSPGEVDNVRSLDSHDDVAHGRTRQGEDDTFQSGQNEEHSMLFSKLHQRLNTHCFLYMRLCISYSGYRLCCSPSNARRGGVRY